MSHRGPNLGRDSYRALSAMLEDAGAPRLVWPRGSGTMVRKSGKEPSKRDQHRAAVRARGFKK
jgi:hypothetical protein